MDNVTTNDFTHFYNMLRERDEEIYHLRSQLSQCDSELEAYKRLRDSELEAMRQQREHDTQEIKRLRESIKLLKSAGTTIMNITAPVGQVVAQIDQNTSQTNHLRALEDEQHST